MIPCTLLYFIGSFKGAGDITNRYLKSNLQLFQNSQKLTMEANITTENFDCVVNNFEKFINEVFSGNDETQKTKLIKKFEEFNTVGSLYKNSKIYMPIEKLSMEANSNLKRRDSIDYTKMAEDFNKVMGTLCTLYRNSETGLPQNTELPNEIWMKILNHLTTKDIFGNFALVCKRFNGLTMDSGTIKFIQLSNFKTEGDTSKMEKALKVLKRCHFLKSLSIDECCNSYVNTFAIQAFLTCPRLKSLKITNCERICIEFLDLEVNPYHWFSNTEEEEFTLLDVLKQSGIKLENFELKTVFALSERGNEEIFQIPKIMAQSLKVLKIHAKIISPAEIDALVSDENQIEIIHLKTNIMYRHISLKLQCRAALNRLLGKTAKTLKSIHFPDIHSDHINQRREIPLKNLSLCKNLEEIMFNLAAHDMQYTLDLHKLKKVKNEKCNANSGKDLLKTKLNDFITRQKRARDLFSML